MKKTHPQEFHEDYKIIKNKCEVSRSNEFVTDEFHNNSNPYEI